MKTIFYWWKPLFSWRKPFFNDENHFFSDENQNLLIKTTLNHFEPLWTTFLVMKTIFNWWGPLWTTFFVMKTKIYWWKVAPNQFFRDDFFENHFEPLFTTFQIFIKNLDFSSMNATLPANSNQRIWGGVEGGQTGKDRCRNVNQRYPN